MNRFYDPLLSTISEGIKEEEFVIATYLIGANPTADISKKIAAIALQQSTGTWIDVPEETDEIRKKHAAKVIGIYSIPDYELSTYVPDDIDLRHYVVRIAFPWVNFGKNIPLMLATIAGSLTSFPNLKLIDVDFPKSFTSLFKGPKFGIDGFRKILNVYDRPFLNNTPKPCTGFPPEIGAKLVYEVAAGGVDWVKDDEVISGSTSFCSLEERVKQYTQAAKRAFEISGENTIYAVNISDMPSKLKENAKIAIESGAGALMITAFTQGLGSLVELAEDPDINIPILCHTAHMGSISAAPFTGISSPVLAKFARLAGADIFLSYTPSAKFNSLKEKFIRIYQVCLSEFYDIKKVMPMTGGGVNPGRVESLINDFGVDMTFGVGGAIHAHPMGPRAGARAMRQAISAALNGMPIEEAANQYEELRVAVEAWGIYGKEDQSKLFSAVG